jgi:hypothetical protein
MTGRFHAPKSLRGKLVLSALTIVLLPIIALCAYIYVRAQNVLVGQAGASYATQANTVINKIDRNLFERYGDVQAFAFHPSASGDAAAIASAADFFCRS